MKVQFEKSDKKYIYIGIFIILFFGLSAFQYLSNRDLKKQIKEKKAEIMVLQNKNDGLLKSVDSLSQVKDSLLVAADSIETQETYYKNKFYATNKKLQDILNGYSGLSDDDKWDAFSRAVNN